MAAEVKPNGQETIPPSLAQDAVLLQSEPMPEGSETVQGYNWSVVSRNGEVDYHALLESYRTSGFQAMSFGLAVQQINEMARSILIYIVLSVIIVSIQCMALILTNLMLQHDPSSWCVDQ